MVGLFKSLSSPICSSPRVYCSSERAIVFFFAILIPSPIGPWVYVAPCCFRRSILRLSTLLLTYFLNVSYHSIKLSPNELSWDCNYPQAIAAENFLLFCACYVLFPRRITNIRASITSESESMFYILFTLGDSADEKWVQVLYFG